MCGIGVMGVGTESLVGEKKAFACGQAGAPVEVVLVVTVPVDPQEDRQLLAAWGHGRCCVRTADRHVATGTRHAGAW